MVTPQQLQEALSHQKMNGGKLGKAFVSPRLRAGRGDHQPPVPPVRRAVDQPRSLRGRSDHHQDHPRRDLAQVPGPAPLPLRRDAHHRHGRPHERLRHGRHQVHDRLQRGAGGGVGDLARGGDRQVLRVERVAAAQAGRVAAAEAAGGSALGQAGRGSFPQGRDGRSVADLRRHGVGRPERGRPRLDRRGRGGRRDGEGRGRRDRPGRPVQVLRGGARHQALERPPHRRPEARRLRHPHRALREGVPGPVPDRRHPLQRAWRCP